MAMVERMARAGAVWLVVSLGASGCAAQPAALVEAGSVWSYLDTGVAPDGAWTGVGFDDSGWGSGAAQLGYGDGDEATVVGYGPSSTSKYITTWFRHEFEVADAGLFPYVRIGLLRDDGAVVHVNGAEVWRSNMPEGPIGHLTTASGTVGGVEEDAWFERVVESGVLVSGTNVVAVEIHQASGSSSDISFDLSLGWHDGTPTVVRGPYLQMLTPGSVVVRWRTDIATESVVRYGDAVGSLTESVVEGALTTEHEVEVGGLSSSTRSFYSVGDASGAVVGDDSEHFFETGPEVGSDVRTRMWVLGDSGTADANAAAVRDAYFGFAGGDRADLVLMLGDNAYNDGTDAEYQAAVFEMYPTVLRNTVLWPTLGNHDGHTADSASETGPYYEIFSLPRGGEAGGMASGTEAYYSFDHANVHFVCLDSYETDRSVDGAMLTWLEADLASTAQEWLIAFWHHPPYSKGSHDSDTETQLVEMRENVLPILEDAGVDLVLAGHSHSYERSYLIDGHYGTSGTFDPQTMLVDGGDGDEAGDGAYSKVNSGLSGHGGAVYAVAGSSGKTSGGLLNHPVMLVNLNTLGSMVIDVESNRLDAWFLDSTGAVRDRFTMEKPAQCAADLDGDHDTDVFDFGQFALHFGSSVTPGTNGDLDGDGDVDVFDFGMFVVDFGCG